MASAAAACGLSQAQASNGLDVTVTQRVWAPTWKFHMQDGAVSSVGGQPVVQTEFLEAKSDREAFSITLVTLHSGAWSLGASISPRTKFSGLPAAGGSIARSEYDLSLGYSVAPGLSLSLIRKGGRVYGSSTAALTQLTGVSGGQRLSNWMFGVSGSLPMATGWSLYANAAYGPGKTKADLGPIGSTRFDTRYTIGEAGVAYSIDWQQGVVQGMDLRLGYRTQIVKVRDAQRLTLAVPSLTPLAVELGDIKSTTAGMVISASVVF